MDSVPIQHCHACRRDMHIREDRWWHMTHAHLGPVVYCTDCVQLRPWILHPQESLLTPEGDRPSRARGKDGNG